MRKFRHILEYVIFLLVYYVVSVLPIRVSSYLMGKLFSILGPLLPVSKIAEINLQFAFSDSTSSARRNIIKRMWENLGRTVGEFPHIVRFSKQKIDYFVNLHNIKPLLEAKKRNQKVVLLTGHFGNWETSLKRAESMGLDLAVIYRKINNPLIDKFIYQLRDKIKVKQIPKNVHAVKDIFKAIEERKFVCMLADQKQNTGIASLFFGKKVMTGTLPAKLALKKDVLLFPAMSVRNSRNPLKFDLYIEEALEVKKSDSIETITQKINDMYQRWITRYPEQWFWVHKRWPKELYKNN